MSLPFDARALANLPDAADVARHDHAVWDLRLRRDAAARACPDFEALREQAAAIRAHVLDHLDRYLERFEEQACAAGAVVHWARDAASHNRTVARLLAERGVTRAVKSKSMLSEECGLNHHLAERGIDVVDTDLGERIVQLAGQPPSHIVVPAIHMRRQEIGELFQRTMGGAAGESDPARLTQLARERLRPRFLEAQAGITGVNFALAESGTLVIVTNEGNADLGTALPPLHIACMGIEKVLPGLEELGVLLRLLARSATGQALSAYTSLLRGPRPSGELHIVIVDNGRTRVLASETHRGALACVRCGACLNTCPVYRRAGGHAYGLAVAGPIGQVLAPALEGSRRARSLPLASTLCGSCSAVCPVRIDLHGQLLAWRREVPGLPRRVRAAVVLAGLVLSRASLLRAAGRLLRLAWPLIGRRFPGNPVTGWLQVRELPPHPGASFRQRMRQRRRTAP